jgi:hypothetical protein
MRPMTVRLSSPATEIVELKLPDAFLVNGCERGKIFTGTPDNGDGEGRKT